MASSEKVTSEYRDHVFKTIRQDNLMCFDCKSKNPKWCSANMGVFICYTCTSNHRNFGTHISFVRSADMDKWTLKQLTAM